MVITSLAVLETRGKLTTFAKCEYRNPTGSIKYRIARRIIEDAEKGGRLQKGMGIVEVTSGNTGRAFAALGKERGYPVAIALPAYYATQTTVDAIKAYGAEVIVKPDWASCVSAVGVLMSSSPDHWFFAKQTENPSVLGSNQDLGREILAQFKGLGLGVDVFAASMGTGGTITGVGSILKENNPNAKVYLIAPDGEYKYPGVDDPKESTVELPLFDPRVVDGEVRVKEADAIRAARELHAKGHKVGVSAGAAFAAIRKIQREFDANGNAVIIFPDSADRYPELWG